MYDDGGKDARIFSLVTNFSLHCCVQNISGIHLASYTVGTGGSFPGDEAAGA